MNEQATNALICCPRCGGKSGYYDQNIQTYQQDFNWQGEATVASEPNHVKGGKLKYCLDCHKNITKCLKNNE